MICGHYKVIEIKCRIVKNKLMLATLIGLAVLGGVTSQSLMDAASTCVLLVLIWKLFNKNISLKELRPIGIEWAFLGYFAVAVVGLLINGKPPVPWFFYLSKFNWVLNLYIFIIAFNRIDFDVNKWFKYFICAFTIPNLYALVTYFTQYDYLTKKNLNGGVIGIVDSATYHAHGNSLIFVFFASFFVVYFEKLSKNMKILSGLALLLMGASIFSSFTRGIWGATFISMLVLLLIRNRKWALYFVGTSILALALLITSSSLVRTRVVNTFTANTDNLRLELINVHLEMFKKHPIVGIGYWESYRQISDYWPEVGRPASYFETHAHNQIVSVLSTTGLLGAFFYLCIVCFFTHRAWIYYNETKTIEKYHGLSVACLILILQFFLACLTDVTFEYAKIRGILIIGLALLISFSFRKNKAL
jgi:O-antigen ligase